MADPAEIVLAFLQRYQFVNAEAAFKAELLSRGNRRQFLSPSENVQNWDKQIRRRDGSAFESAHEQMVMSVGEMEALRGCNGGDPPGIAYEEAKSPPEKQLYVEYEPARLSPQDAPCAASDEFTFGGVTRLPESDVSIARASPAGASWVASFPQVDRPELAETVVTENTANKSSHEGTEVYVTKQQPPPYADQVFQAKLDTCCEKSILPCTTSSDMHAEGAVKECGRLESACHTSESKASCSNLSPERSQVGHSNDVVEQADKEAVGLAMASMSLDGEKAQKDSFANDLFSLSFPNPAQITQQQGLLPKRASSNNGKKSNELTWDGELTQNPEKIRLQGAGMKALSQQRTHDEENMNLSPSSVREREELPRLPPVRLHFADSNIDTFKSKTLLDQNENVQNVHSTFDSKALGCTEGGLAEDDFGWSRIIDCPLGQDLPASGSKRPVLRPSVSQGIVEALSEQLCGVVDGQNDRWSSDGYCDSDTYEDDDDPGYVRQPIDDEEWFLAHEVDYHSDGERARQHPEKSTLSRTVAEDDRSFVEEESYFSGEEYYRSQAAKKSYPLKPDSGSLTFSKGGHDGGHAYGTEEPDTMSSQPGWKGFMGPPGVQDDAIFDGYKFAASRTDGSNADDTHGSVKSGGVLVSSDVADIGSEVRDSLLGGSSEGGDAESLKEQEEVVSHDLAMESFDTRQFLGDDEKRGRIEGIDYKHDMVLQYYNEAWGLCQRATERELASRAVFKPKEMPKSKESVQGLASNGGTMFEGFSFPSPSSTGDVPLSTAGSMKSLWSNRESLAQGDETDGYGSGMVGPDDTVAAWKRKSSDTSSPIICSEAGAGGDADLSKGCPPLNREDEDALAGQEEMRTLGADEDQYEVFNLRIIHRKNRTGFEEDKEFPVMINSVVAGRYHVTEYLGSAAFSKAIQAHDLQTGMDVCMKIIKNNKDFFDQSLDEIKLLKYVNKHDPLDKYHILRLYDYFYHREHLFIVCELLRANLYEFHKFNRESGGEVYFTMPRLQSITRQCLEALEFLHRLGIIHCDLKPENILVKSYSRCEIKIIDLGSSCFQTDHLCSYVQSRSYRAPEVILGLPYDQKIDIWSLGCILAELCTGNVLFQNDSLATLLARVVGILGPIDAEVLAKGRDTHKYFTKNFKIYERNQETDQLEYLLPKKTSLAHRLPMGDPGFVEFTGYLLQCNPAKRPTATQALQHPWLYYPYEPISS